MEADQKAHDTAIYKFKLCRFSAMIRAQAKRTIAASAAIHKMLGRRPLVYGNGLKHSFYWTGRDAIQVRDLYRELHPPSDPNDMAPFSPNASENVIYYKVKGTRDMMSRPNGALDGFNMESFYGFIEVGLPVSCVLPSTPCSQHVRDFNPCRWATDAPTGR